MNLYVIGAGCSKSYEESFSNQRMPIAKDFFKTFNKLPNLTENRWVLVGTILNALKELKGISLEDPFRDEFDIEAIHTLIESKLYEAMGDNDYEQSGFYFKSFTELVFLFSAVVNEISNGHVSQAHVNFVDNLKENDSVITFNWDTLLDRALSERTTWNTHTGYYVKPNGIFRDKWKVNNNEKISKINLLKMHGSSNWLTGAVMLKPEDTQFQMMQELSPEQFFVYEHATKPYHCYDGRWEKIYQPFSYGYYPPNLPLKGKALPEGYAGFSFKMRSPFHAPKGEAGDSGLISMPLIIPPVKNKTYQFYGELFSNIWKKAECDIRDAETITFIGYSFPVTDTKTIQLFKNALMKRKTIPFINIIDPFPERVVGLLMLDFGIPEDKINTIKDYFSKDFDFTLLKNLSN